MHLLKKLIEEALGLDYLPSFCVVISNSNLQPGLQHIFKFCSDFHEGRDVEGSNKSRLFSKEKIWQL